MLVESDEKICNTEHDRILGTIIIPFVSSFSYLIGPDTAGAAIQEVVDQANVAPEGWVVGDSIMAIGKIYIRKLISVYIYIYILHLFEKASRRRVE